MIGADPSGRIESRDIEEHRELVQPWDVDFCQLSPGRFQGSLEYVLVNDLLIYRERWSHRVAVTGTSPPGFFMFGSALPETPNVRWCGDSAEPSMLACGRPGSELDFTIQDGGNHVVLLVPVDKLLRAGCDPQRSSRFRRQPNHLNCSSASGIALVDLLNQSIDRYVTCAGRSALAVEASVVEASIMSSLARIVEESTASTRLPSGRTSRAIVRRALETIGRSGNYSRIPAIAADANVSQRTLERAFLAELGVTPISYIKHHKMKIAHRNLVNAEHGERSVSEIAAEAGISELGRFSVEYKRLFGESPNETLRSPRLSVRSDLGDVATLAYARG